MAYTSSWHSESTLDPLALVSPNPFPLRSISFFDLLLAVWRICLWTVVEVDLVPPLGEQALRQSYQQVAALKDRKQGHGKEREELCATL